MEFIKSLFCLAVVVVALSAAFGGEAGPLEVSPPLPRSTFVKPDINDDGWAISWPGRERHLYSLNQTRIGLGLVKPGSADPNTYR